MHDTHSVVRQKTMFIICFLSRYLLKCIRLFDKVKKYFLSLSRSLALSLCHSVNALSMAVLYYIQPLRVSPDARIVSGCYRSPALLVILRTPLNDILLLGVFAGHNKK